MKFDVLKLYEDHHFLAKSQHHSILRGGLDTGMEIGSTPQNKEGSDAIWCSERYNGPFCRPQVNSKENLKSLLGSANVDVSLNYTTDEKTLLA
eukprot:CAMPEP_0170480220 /NCGR_PEP_ID=MMETSP0208-20121228/1147_1 /TAXON_ID=197538 /ORGANISM="Strombidium inclinatum, Strain S3" /LENGTH=92 /DNA_ID=CAMNT_0010752731 /DNA_START=931 /DNA_END=1209 /DNA_ORIENTATION=+